MNRPDKLQALLLAAALAWTLTMLALAVIIYFVGPEL